MMVPVRTMPPWRSRTWSVPTTAQAPPLSLSGSTAFDRSLGHVCPCRPARHRAPCQYYNGKQQREDEPTEAIAMFEKVRAAGARTGAMPTRVMDARANNNPASGVGRACLHGAVKMMPSHFAAACRLSRRRIPQRNGASKH